MTTPFSQDFIEEAFLGEVLSQAVYCLDAYATLQQSLSTPRAVDHAYRALHSLLAHAGNLSKLLWPPIPRDKLKAVTLRSRSGRLLSRLNLKSHIAPVLESRELRNHLEHFDERLDAWAATNPTILVDRNLGPLSGFGGITPSMVLRHFDPATGMFIFAGVAYDINALVKAVAEVRDAAQAARKPL